MNDNHALCWTREWSELIGDEVVAYMTAHADLGESMLEIGPGPGAATEWLRHEVGRLVALELDEEAAALLASRFAGTNVEVVVGDATALGDPDGHFDSVGCFTMLHHVPCADVWGGCMLETLSEDRPTLRAVNPRSWIASTDYFGLEFPPSLRAFVSQRSDLLAVLEHLPEEAWSRTATVTGAGKVLERTVLGYGWRMARHERPHVRQIERTLEAVRR